MVNDVTQLYLISQVLDCTSKRLDDPEKVVSWKCKGLSTEKIPSHTTVVNSLSPSISWNGNPNFCISFKGSRLKQKKTQLLLLEIEQNFFYIN